MRRIYLKQLLATILLLCSSVANAHDFEVGGIYYNITNATAKTVEVTCKGSDSNEYLNEYSGEVTIPATVTYNGITYSVTSIGDYAFYACEDLQTVLLPNSIESIKRGAFSHTGISSITIPASVTGAIDYDMFYMCSSLNEIVVDENNKVYDSREDCNAIVKTANNEIIVGSNNSTIPAGIVSIGERAFDSRIGLEELILPSGFKTIGESAFRACSGLKKVYISETVTSIGQGAFGVCSEIESIVVDENNKVLDSREDCNAIIHTSTNSLLVGCKNSFIPTTITSIGAYAFFNANKLEFILIPASVTSIGDWAFYGCSSLKCMASMATTAPSLGTYSLGDGFAYLTGTLYTPNSTTDNYSEWNKYFETQNMVYPSKCGENVISCIISDVLHIWGAGNIRDMKIEWDEYSPWYGGDKQREFSSVKIHHGVKSIGYGAFYDCQNYKSIEIPNSVTSIGEYAFYRCKGLTSITIPGSVTSIGDKAFLYCSGLKSVTIPSSVTGIGNYAFEYCTGLTSITIPGSVTSIGDRAFRECTGLTSVTIPGSVTSIGDRAFDGCIRLTSVTIPGSVTSIGNYAFNGCTRLTSVTIGNSVTSIGDYAFNGCAGLTSITIPASVTSIGNRAFYGCTGLTSIEVESGNTKYDSRGGCNAIIETATSTLITGCKNTIIPEGVTSIGDRAFYECRGLISITIPNSVTSIGDRAFYGCDGLTSVTIGNGVTSIGEGAFFNCTVLTSVTIPNSVTSIGDEAFRECDGLTSVTIGNGVTSIGSGAFYYCTGLTSVTIPGSVTSIESAAFSDCTGLTSITIPGSVTSIGNYAFAWCDGLTSITSLIPAENLFAIDSYVFNGVDKTTCPLYVPAGAKATYQATNGWKAFTNIEELLTTTFPAYFTTEDGLPGELQGDNYVWETETMRFETAKESIRLTVFETNAPDAYNNLPMVALGELEFYDGNGNKIAYTADNVTTNSLESTEGSLAGLCDGDYSTFYHSTWKNGTTPGSHVYVEVNFPQAVDALSVKIVGRTTQRLVPTKIGLTDGGVLCGFPPVSGSCGENVTWLLFDGVLTISGTGAMTDYEYSGAPWYEYYEDITSVVIEEGITHIGDYAFSNCPGLTSVTIPGSVTSIGNYAFSWCPGLTSITIPASVTNIGVGAFSWCSGLTSIEVESGNTKYDSRGGCNAIIETATITLITGCKNTIIPEGVTSIGDEAFQDCDGLTSVEIPNSVTSIGEGAFSFCSDLTSIEIPGSVTSIGSAAFHDCNLTSIVIPASVTNIGRQLFSVCNNLTSIEVESGNTKYDSRGGCNAIIETATNTLIAGCKNTIIPEGVTSIGDLALFQCFGLTSIEIPASVTSIGLYAFDDCNLTSIIIPAGVTSIGNYAFDGCNLTSITSLIPAENLFAIDSSVFDFDKTACTLYVPYGAKATYEATDGWNEFTNIEEILSGTCGANATWILVDGVLTIRGTGAMTDYEYSGASWYEYREDITSVVVKEGITHIGDYAFSDCGLTSITIPNSVTSIGNYAFYWCAGLTSITIPAGVTSIGDYAFYGCGGLTSITIPAGVTNIGVGAFSWCAGLTSIEVESGNTKYDSRGGCNAIIETATNTLIAGCKNTIIPGNVTGIGNFAFNGCAGLTSITIPGSVTSLGFHAFSGCTSLTSITIPDSVTSIGDYAFQSCYGLTSITIPEGVTSIGNQVFDGCTGLTSITIPAGVTSIGYYAFQSCTGLTSIISLILPEDLFAIDSSVFDFDKTACILYVPYGAKATYEATDGWSEFTNIEEIDEVTITINQYGSATYSSRYALDFSEVEGLKAYAATGYNIETQVVTLTRVNTAQEGIGLFLKGEPGEYIVPIIERSKDCTLNMLVGTQEQTTINATSDDDVYANYVYTIKAGDEEPLFYRASDNLSLPSGKAYMQIPLAWLPATPSRALAIRFDNGTTTDIDAIESNKEDGIYYDLSGRPVANPSKGIYILNGKKVFVK